jgi:hypothetical protein
MDLGIASLLVNVALLLGLVVLAQRLSATRAHVADLTKDAAFAAGYEKGRKELLDSIRYEREIHECRRTGVIKKETALKIRERVMLGNLRLAEADREVVLSSEVDQENVWSLLDRAGQALVAPELGAVIQTITPAVRKLLASKK